MWDPFSEFKEETIKFNFRLKIVTSNVYQANEIVPVTKERIQKNPFDCVRSFKKVKWYYSKWFIKCFDGINIIFKKVCLYRSSLCCSSLISANYWINSFLHRIFKESCFISFLLYNRYDSSFRINTHRARFVQEINIYNPGQNVCSKVKKSSEIGQDQETLISSYA